MVRNKEELGEHSVQCVGSNNGKTEGELFYSDGTLSLITNDLLIEISCRIRPFCW